jgi:hypothetical protein
MCGRTVFVIRMTPGTLMCRTFWAWVTEFSSTTPAERVAARRWQAVADLAQLRRQILG